MNKSNEEILTELKKITKLLVAMATKDQTQREQVKLLNAVGLQPKDIAELLGITGNAARVALHSVRKARKKKTRKREPSLDEVGVQQ